MHAYCIVVNHFFNEFSFVNHSSQKTFFTENYLYQSHEFRDKNKYNLYE